MTVLGHIKRMGDELVVVLDEQAQALLNAAPGDAVVVSKSDEAASEEARLERGRKFLDRYRSTFEALAK